MSGRRVDAPARGGLERCASRVLGLWALFAGAACAAGSARADEPAPARPRSVVTPGPKLVQRTHTAMGTQNLFVAYEADEARVEAAFREAFEEIDRLERLLTVWRPESDVSRINVAAGKGAVPVAPETFEVIEKAVELSRLTDGKFDITFGALSGLWRFDHDKDNVLPNMEEVRKRLPLIDWTRIRLDPKARTVQLERPGMSMHLGGIGKGYAVDRVVALLRKRGLSNFMVQSGGDLYVAGRRGDRPWRVGVRDPRAPEGTYFASIELTDATFSTSGDYERFFIQGERRYHHIIDPDLGEPATACRSVTIMTPDATTAEGLSKGVFILGPERGLALIEKIPGAGAVIVDAKNQLHISRRLQGRVVVLRPPTGGL